MFRAAHGQLHQSWAGLYRKGLGSDFTYNRYGLDLRRYWRLHGTHSLALAGLRQLYRGHAALPPAFQARR